MVVELSRRKDHPKMKYLLISSTILVAGCTSTIIPPDHALPEDNCQIRVADIRADTGTFTFFSDGGSVEGAGLVVTQMGECKTPVDVTNGTKSIKITPEGLKVE